MSHRREHLGTALASSALQVAPSALAIGLLTLVEYVLAPDDRSYLPFYFASMISLVKSVSDFGLSRAFIRIFSNGTSEGTCAFFAKCYVGIAVLLTVITFVYLKTHSKSLLLATSMVFPLSASLIFDGYMYCKARVFQLHLIDAIFFTTFYVLSYYYVLTYNTDQYLLLLALLSWGVLLVKILQNQDFFSDLKASYKSTGSLTDQETREFKSSIASSSSIALYKQVERIALMVTFSPQLFAFYQVTFQALSKLFIAPMIFTRQFLVLASRGEGKADFFFFLKLIAIFASLIFAALCYGLYLFAYKIGIERIETYGILLGAIAGASCVCQFIRAAVVGYVSGREIVISDWIISLTICFMILIIAYIDIAAILILVMSLLYYLLQITYGFRVLRNHKVF